MTSDQSADDVPVKDSPMWWRQQPHEHVVGRDPRSGPDFCKLCWIELDLLTHQPQSGRSTTEEQA